MAREWWGFRKTTRPLAREGRNLRSESDVFYRPLFGRIAPFPGRSGPSRQILDSVGALLTNYRKNTGYPGPGDANPRECWQIWQPRSRIHRVFTVAPQPEGADLR